MLVLGMCPPIDVKSKLHDFFMLLRGCRQVSHLVSCWLTICSTLQDMRAHRFHVHLSLHLLHGQGFQHYHR